MQRGEGRRWASMAVASLMLIGAFIVAIAPTVLANGGTGGGPIQESIIPAPIGNYQFVLNVKEAIGPEDVASFPNIAGVNNTAEIQQYTGPGGAVSIPTFIQYQIEGPNGAPTDVVLRVASIGAEAFKGHTDITSIMIPEGVEFIGASAFSGCINLIRIDFLGIAMPSDVSDQWLLGTNTGLLGYANDCPGIDVMGTDYHGLMVYHVILLSSGPVILAPLTGMITDAAGKPVAGVIVATVADANTTTDADGYFILMAPVGFNSFSVSGSSLQQTSFNAYLGMSGTEVGKVSATLASGNKSIDVEGVALMVAVIAIAVVLLMISMLVSRKRVGKE